MKPEFEIYELTCNTIRTKLKTIVKGYVRVGVDNDILKIHIDNNGFEFNYVVDDYLDYVLINGTDGILEGIKVNYTKAIRNKYFY